MDGGPGSGPHPSNEEAKLSSSKAFRASEKANASSTQADKAHEVQDRLAEKRDHIAAYNAHMDAAVAHGAAKAGRDKDLREYHKQAISTHIKLATEHEAKAREAQRNAAKGE